MKFEYDSKSKEYDASGAASATKVVLRNREGAYVPVFLPVEKIELSNTDLLKEALEVIYQENFPQRAENEKFNKIEEQIKKHQDVSNTSQLTLIDIIDKLYDKKVLTDEDLTKIKY